MSELTKTTRLKSLFVDLDKSLSIFCYTGRHFLSSEMSLHSSFGVQSKKVILMERSRVFWGLILKKQLGNGWFSKMASILDGPVDP